MSCLPDPLGPQSCPHSSGPSLPRLCRVISHPQLWSEAAWPAVTGEKAKGQSQPDSVYRAPAVSSGGWYWGLRLPLSGSNVNLLPTWLEMLYHLEVLMWVGDSVCPPRLHLASIWTCFFLVKMSGGGGNTSMIGRIPWQSSSWDSALSLLRARVRSLVGELRSHKPPEV